MGRYRHQEGLLEVIWSLGTKSEENCPTLGEQYAECKEFKPAFFIQMHHHISLIPLDNTIKTKETIYQSIIATLKLLV